MPSAILSKRFGGKAKIKSYCRMYEMKPLDMSDRALCHGVGFWPPCPDYSECRCNEVCIHIRKTKRPS